jgi:RND family efflux transporter MFP subunit
MTEKIAGFGKPVLTLVGALLVAFLIIATGKTPERVPVVDQGVLVTAVPVETVSRQLLVSAKGKVVPSMQVSVRPEVGGRVVGVNPQLLPGGFLAAGDVLFEIDATDYRQAVAVAEAALADAQARLALERGRQEIASKEWALFENDPDAAAVDSELALRRPQLKSAEAAVAAAQARLDQEELRLQRTRVRADFNAIVRREFVDIGQVVGPQVEAAVIAGTDIAWVQAAVPFEQLASIRFPAAGSTGAAVTVRYDAGGSEVRRQGNIIRLLGDLEPAGQMARILVEIEDPLDLQRTGEIGDQGLLFDSFVELEIQGPSIDGLVELPRAWLHNGETVYVFNNGELDIRKVTVAWRQANSVYIRTGLQQGDWIVTSPLATPVAGMRLRLKDDAGHNPAGTEEAS